MLYPWVKTEKSETECFIDFELKKKSCSPHLGNFADISYLDENVKPHLLRDICTLCSGALVSDSLNICNCNKLRKKSK